MIEKISFIIISWNSEKTIEMCLTGIIANTLSLIKQFFSEPIVIIIASRWESFKKLEFDKKTAGRGVTIFYGDSLD